MLCSKINVISELLHDSLHCYLQVLHNGRCPHQCKFSSVDVDVLISGCACLLNSMPKAKFDSTRGLPVSSPVWT
jgi:hypothetical protein